MLRDGAAAQYGSDAIAGVMNFQLKDAAAGGAVSLNAGTHLEGDGETYSVAGNVGLPLGRGGFANLSLEYGSVNPTNRSAPAATPSRFARRPHQRDVGHASDLGIAGSGRHIKFFGTGSILISP